MNFEKQNHTVVSITLLTSGVIEFRDRSGVFHADKATTIFTKSGKSYIGVEVGSKGFQFDLWSYAALTTPTGTITYPALSKLDTDDFTYEAQRIVCLSDLISQVNKIDSVDVTINNTIGGAETIYNEVPSGAVNGVNVTFTSAFNFDNTLLSVFLNGVLQKIVDDYNTSGTNTITFAVSPLTGEKITINYVKQ